MSYTVTEQEIDQLLDTAQTSEKIFWGKELIVSYLLESGFTVSGRSACIDPDNFNLEIGRKYAREDAKSQLWQLEGYRKQVTLREQGLL